jgi:hypothetical protein
MIENRGNNKLGLVGSLDAINNVFFFKNQSIFARKQGDFIGGYENIQNAVYGVNGPSFTVKDSSFNTAIGYQSVNSDFKHELSIFLGNRAGYDAKNTNRSIIIGNKDDKLITEPKTYIDTVNIGTHTDIGSTRNSVNIGYKVTGSKTNNNVIIGSENKNTKANSILVGYSNLNTGTKSTIIGTGIINNGNNSLLIHPKNEDGIDRATYTNETDNYINIFGLITGSNNQLSLNSEIGFSQAVTFNSEVIIGNSLKTSDSNVSICNLIIENDFFVKSNVIISERLNVNSNVIIGGGLEVNNKAYFNDDIYTSNDIFVQGDNLKDLILKVSASNTNLSSDFSSLRNDILNLQNDSSLLDMIVNNSNDENNRIDELENKVVFQEINVFDNTSNIQYILTKLGENIDEGSGGLDDIERSVQLIMQEQFTSIIQKGLDGTFTFNIVRDSIRNFPDFYNGSDISNFDPIEMPAEITIFSPIDVTLNRSYYIHDTTAWVTNYNNVIYDDHTFMNSM